VSNTTAASRDKLARDFRVVLADAEELFKATANETGERVKTARARLETNLEAARARVADMERSALERARAAAQETDRFAHENPWKTAGIAAGAGFLIGLLIGRTL
jgi:ElaB/YqjD/DUF883 family membrane-anchored ribosome-binding protein